MSKMEIKKKREMKKTKYCLIFLIIIAIIIIFVYVVIKYNDNYKKYDTRNQSYLTFLAKFSIEELGAKKAIVVNNVFSSLEIIGSKADIVLLTNDEKNIANKELIDIFIKSGGELIIRRTDLDLLNEIKKTNPDVIFLGYEPTTDETKLLERIRDSGYDKIIFYLNNLENINNFCSSYFDEILSVEKTKEKYIVLKWDYDRGKCISTLYK